MTSRETGSASAASAASAAPNATPERERFLDVVVCTYNNAALLDRTLASIARQRVPADVEWGVVVVDNNCTDETVDVVERHARSSPVEMRLVHEPTQGLNAARACGVTATRGRWVAFVDDDSLLDDDWVAQAARFGAEHPDCGAFGGQVALEWETDPPAYVARRRYLYAGKSHGQTAQRRRWLAGTGMVVRREALEACGWTRRRLLGDRAGTALRSGGDMEIGLRIATRYEAWYTPACRLRHVIPERRTTRQYVRRMTFELCASRHHVMALTWRGSYAGWLAYSAAYSVGVAALGVFEVLRDVVSRSRTDPLLAVSPARGWWSAMWRMLRMRPEERKELIGCAAAVPKHQHA